MASHAYVDGARMHGEQERLLVRSGQGDVDAFAELYDCVAPRVFGLVTSLVQDADASEAVTCEAFVEAWRRSSTYDPDRCSAEAWILVVAHGLAVQARRASTHTTERPRARPSASSSPPR